MFDELIDQAIEDDTVDPDGLHLFRVKFNDAGEMYGLTQVTTNLKEQTVSETQQILLTRQQVAGLCHVSYKTIERAEADGKLKSIKLGKPKTNRVLDNRPVRFYIGDVAEFLGVTVEDIREALAELVERKTVNE